MIKNILCFFGLHDWKYLMFRRRQCKNCLKAQEQQYDFWLPFWTDL